MQLTFRQKAAFGIGAVGKDMVYMLSATYVMFYYQDVIGLNASFVGLILMIARVFDAVNDPFMGILVAKTRSRWGRFRPWLVSGTVLNAFVLYAMFAAPSLSQGGMMVFFSVIYILWGTTYTMMDIPYWSMIPAITHTPSDTEHLSVIGRTCAGVGSAIIQMLTLALVGIFGGGDDRAGFRIVALIVAVLFVITELFCAASIREREDVRMQTSTIREMFSALFRNDQALIVVLVIVLINTALWVTSNLVIYFFKYDFGGDAWRNQYTLFVTVGGACQILGMMIVYPLLRRFLSNPGVFKTALGMSFFGYGVLLIVLFIGQTGNLPLLLVPGAFVFAANGILSVLTTVFLSNSVDYGELRTGRRDESVIFSMQTFVVKAASGVAVFIAGVGLDLIGMTGNSEEEGEVVAQSAQTILGLRLLMTVLPIIVLLCAIVLFIRKFRLTDEAVKENARLCEERRARGTS